MRNVLRAMGVAILLTTLALPVALAKGNPSLAIVSPTSGQKITSTDISVQVNVSNFEVNCLTAGRPDQDGQGHIHVMLDGMKMAQLINFFCADTFTISGQGLKSGQHTLIVDLASNTHMDMMSTAQEVKFDYEPTTPPPDLPAAANTGTPSIKIAAPATGAGISSKFTLQMNWSNFQPSCDLEGKQNVLGYGHIHVFVDPNMSGGMLSMAGMISMPCATSLPVDLSAWPQGKHTIMVQLVNNDHTPLMPAAEDMITVNTSETGSMPTTGGQQANMLGLLVLLALVLIGAGFGTHRLVSRRLSRPSPLS